MGFGHAKVRVEETTLQALSVGIQIFYLLFRRIQRHIKVPGKNQPIGVEANKETTGDDRKSLMESYDTVIDQKPQMLRGEGTVYYTGNRTVTAFVNKSMST